MDFSIETVKLDKIKEWDKNPRLHNVEELKKSIDRFGFRNVVVVNKRTMTCEAGHGRLQAAHALGMREVPVLFVDDDDDTAAAFAIADNRMGELAEWKEDELLQILEDLKAKDEDLLGSIGFSNFQLEMMLARLQPEETGSIMMGDTLPEAFDNWRNSDVKQMVFIFSADVFDDLIRRFEVVREEKSLSTNADVVLMLLEEYENGGPNNLVP